MGNKEILVAIMSSLSTGTEYGLSVDYDVKGNPIMKVAPVVKVTPAHATKMMKVSRRGTASWMNVI